MANINRFNSVFIGLCLLLGLVSLGYQLGESAIRYKEYERQVTVKGLSEREYKADIVIWPIQFTVADNNLSSLYQTIEASTGKIRAFLEDAGLNADEISFTGPSIIDKSAQQYGGQAQALFRYTATQTVTVYSKNIDVVRGVMGNISVLGKQGIVFNGNDYSYQTEYIFTRLNEIKPEMIEEATKKAREVAEKFASDSKSTLGKIRTASQGQFSISARDKNNPHIKKVRVVSTVSYYLSD
ncbi:SIMPL domain-containing protein [Marinomonas sp. 15G1-11]|uniref:SIMPL domain-containing protein n=1 Tax=Marinomonas phaeophyticola TaxID=3004091 RepID=A0ABT4JYK6_9GAMM|nr:SIMPL domain-containing protein [Marinomonas sp. 15G1-11]MCZ2723470.1 SIMPL domain-containing protein [Marinomonas sp. 15G1-11]